MTTEKKHNYTDADWDEDVISDKTLAELEVEPNSLIKFMKDNMDLLNPALQKLLKD